MAARNGFCGSYPGAVAAHGTASRRTARTVGPRGFRSEGSAMSSLLQSPGTSAGNKQVAALGPWFHNLHFPDGVQTAPDHPLGDFPRFKWRQLEPALPKDLSGARVLDVGCN